MVAVLTAYVIMHWPRRLSQRVRRRRKSPAPGLEPGIRHRKRRGNRNNILISSCRWLQKSYLPVASRYAHGTDAENILYLAWHNDHWFSERDLNLKTQQ